MEGLSDKFVKKLKRVLPNEINTRVYVTSRRDKLCWEGRSILASLPSFKNMMITRADYQEQK